MAAIVIGFFRKIALKRLCVGFVVTEIHVVATGQCIKPYEALSEDQKQNNRLSVLFNKISIDVGVIRSHPKYKPGKEDSYNIGVITVSRLPNYSLFHKKGKHSEKHVFNPTNI